MAHRRRRGMLIPILVAGYGRSGTTALMTRLSTDRRVAVDRRYPFENRYLTYLTKFALLAGRPGASAHFTPLHLEDYYDDRLGTVPWSNERQAGGGAPLQPTPAEWLRAMWSAFSESVRRTNPDATHYAEKVPAWLWAAVRDVLPCRALHLFRDPRDVFLSARSFVARRGAIGFGMDSGTTEPQQARNVAHGLVTFAENARDVENRNDGLLVRYEDMLQDPARLTATLNAFLGLDLQLSLPSFADLETHRTSASVADSVGRWRSDALPVHVQSTLETQLRDAMFARGYELTPAGNGRPRIDPDPSWPSSPDGQLTGSDDGAIARVRGGDFNFEVTPPPGDAEGTGEVWVCLRDGAGTHCSVYWRGGGEPFAEERCIHLPFIPAPHWQVLRFRVGEHPLWLRRIEGLRVDVFNGGPSTSGQGSVRWISYVG